MMLPGRGYSPAAPLLHYATMLLVERGWTVHQVWCYEAAKTSVEAAVARARHQLDAVGAEVLEVAGADHSLEFGGAVAPAIAALRLVMERMASFVDNLPGAD
jgi:hypothetical protein